MFVRLHEQPELDLFCPRYRKTWLKLSYLYQSRITIYDHLNNDYNTYSIRFPLINFIPFTNLIYFVWRKKIPIFPSALYLLCARLRAVATVARLTFSYGKGRMNCTHFVLLIAINTNLHIGVHTLCGNGRGLGG